MPPYCFKVFFAPTINGYWKKGRTRLNLFRLQPTENYKNVFKRMPIKFIEDVNKIYRDRGLKIKSPIGVWVNSFFINSNNAI